jgi:lauroyl/myristoyl acyltransferase
VLPWKLPETIAWTIGQFSCLFRRKTRRNVEHNLGIIHGESLSPGQRRRMSRRVVMNFSRAILVFLKLPNYEWPEIRDRVDMSDLEAVLASLGERPAFLLASLHMGPWEVGGLCLSRRGYKLHTVALDHPTRQVTDFFDHRRRRIGVINHPMRKSYGALKEALEGGDCVALLVDRAYRASSKRFRFFGVDQKFPMGYLMLAGSTGVPIITGALVFADGDRVRYVQGGVHHPPPEGTRDIDKLEELQEACLRDFEEIIRKHSDQWFHFWPLGESLQGEYADRG